MNTLIQQISVHSTTKYFDNLFNVIIDQYLQYFTVDDWISFSRNSKLNLELLEKYLDKGWDWNVVSQRSFITKEFIIKYPDKPWNWRFLSNNRHVVTMDLVRMLRDKPWDFVGICQSCPKIDMSFI